MLLYVSHCNPDFIELAKSCIYIQLISGCNYFILLWFAGIQDCSPILIAYFAPGYFILEFRKLNKRLIISGLCSTLLYANSICIVSAVDSLPPLSTEHTISPSVPSGMTTVKPESSKIQQANFNLQQLPNLVDLPQTPESIEKVTKMEEEGEKLFNDRLLDKALTKWQDCYGMSLEMKYAEGEGRALTNMGRVFLERGQFVKAKYMGENAIEVLNGVSDKKALGRAHLYLAQAYFGLDNPLWAGQQLDQALKAFSADGGNNAADTARLMNLAASIIINAGKLKEALQFLQAAATYYGQAGDNANAIAERIKIVNVLLALGLYTAAQEEADKALSVARTAPDQLGNLSAALACIANCKFSFGEYLEAKKNYTQVFEYIKKTPKDQITTFSRANLYLGYGTTLAALHSYDQAKQTLDYALPVFKASGASLQQSQTANTLGVVEWQLGHKDKALELLQQSLDLQNLITPKQDFLRNIILTNLAAIQAQVGENRQARVNLDLVASQQRKINNNTALGRTYLALAEVMFRLAEHTEAERYLGDSIKLAQESGDDSVLWRAYTLSAKLARTQGNNKVIRESLLSATSFFRSPQAGDFAKPEQIDFPTRKEYAHDLINLLVHEKMDTDALLVSEQLKQEAFLANLRDAGAKPSGPDAELFKDLNTQRAHLHSVEVINSPAKATKEWQSWLQRFRSLMTRNRAMARLVAPVPVPVAELTKMVDASHSTILDYSIGKDSSVAFVISPGGKVSATTLNTGEKHLTDLINSLLTSFAQPGNPSETLLSDKLLHSLYTALVPDGLHALLPANSNDLLVIIPEGPLEAVPFGALLDNQNKYWIANHTISLSPSLALLQDISTNSSIPGILLVAGASNPGEQIDNIAQAKDIAQGLPSSSVTYLIGEEANLKNIQEQGGGKTSIGVVGSIDLNSNGLNTVLPFKDKDEQSPANAADLFDTTLNCDALLVSGSEIKKFDESKRNVMSPFSTMSYVLRYAGARNNIFSIWQIADNQNQQLHDFFSAQLSGQSPPFALRKAQLAQIAHHARPCTWSFLEVFGPLY